MQKLSVKSVIYINSILLISLLMFNAYQYFYNSTRIAYIENHKVFQEFHMTKELKLEGDKKLNSRKKIIDSLYLELNSNSINKEMIMQQIIMEKENFEEFNQHFVAEESQKIWKRINDYAKDFSEEEGYDLIFGSQTNTSVLYGRDEKNVTQEFINYSNRRYEGN